MQFNTKKITQYWQQFKRILAFQKYYINYMINSNAFSLIKKKTEPKVSQMSKQKPLDALLDRTLANSVLSQSKLSSQGKQRLNINPKQLVFSVQNTQQTKFIQIQNVTSSPIRVKIIRPQTKYFRIIYQNSQRQNYLLSPGLSKRIQVQFRRVQRGQVGTYHDLNKVKSHTSVSQGFYDCLGIALYDRKYSIPIRAIKQQPSLTYQKLFDLKFVDMNKIIKMHKIITNKSSQTIKLKLIKQSWDNLHIVPQQFILQPNGDHQNIQFSITPTNIGAYHHKILVEANGCTLQPIEIVYTTFDYNYCIVDSNAARITQVDFGHIYFGMKKSRIFYAVNNTPNTVQMKGKIRMGFKNNPLQSTFQSPEQFGQECSSTLVQMHPKTLKIAPFGKQKFVLTSLGKITEQHIGKVVKFSKNAINYSDLKTYKRMTQTNQKYKIQDQEFHESFISQFCIINSNPNDDQRKKKQRPQNISKTSIISNIVLTELIVYYSVPTIKFQPTQFDFGKVILGTPANYKLKLTNLNGQLPAKVTFNKIIGVEIFPKEKIIRPNQTKQFQIYVTPVNLGTVNQTLRVTIQENYVIECRLRYDVINNRKLFKVSSAKEKDVYQSVHVDHRSGRDWDQKINFNATLDFLQKSSHKQIDNRTNKLSHSSSHTDFKIRRNNVQSSSKHRLSRESKADITRTGGLKAFRTGTIIRPTDQSSAADVGEMDNYKKANTTSKRKRIDNSQIQHFEQECQNTQVVRQTRISLPSTKENLFVTKKIDRYEPYAHNLNPSKLLKSKTTKDFFSNVVRRQPRNRRQAQQIQMQLKGQSLKLIKINTKNINFGKMFVGSRMQKEFIVDNQTQYGIEIKLKQGEVQNQIQKLYSQMLVGTDYQEQIVPSHSAVSFKVCLSAKQCGKFQKAISYTINKIHQFQFLVEADIQLAALTINKNTIKMSYQDDISQMYLKDSFILKNDGNATAQFSISQVNDNFIIEPSKGIVEPGAYLQVFLTYNCAVQTIMNAGQTPNVQKKQQQDKPNPTNNQNFLDQRISVDIKNGINMSMRVTFNPNIIQPKCIVKEGKINLGVTIVSKQKKKSFLLRNLSRSLTLFEIQSNECSQFFYFNIMKGRLPPQSSKQISITYKSSIIQQIDTSFKINIRGGLVIIVPVVAESVAPNIRLQEEAYNFGDVCCGSSQVKAVNIVNESETMVELLLDLLDKGSHGTQYLFVSFVSQQNHIVFDQETGNQKSGILKNKQNNYFSNNQPSTFSIEDQVIVDKACLQPEIHKLKIQPKSVYTFYIVFRPKLPGYYDFELPLYLQNFIKNEALNKNVTCFAIEPKFIVQPSVIRFKKKIINQKQDTNFHPLIQFVTLKNPAQKQLKWKIQYPIFPNAGNSLMTVSAKQFNSNPPNNITSSYINNNVPTLISKQSQSESSKFCFQIQNKKGQVKPFSWQCINIAFNPFEAGFYCYKLPLLIYNEERGVYQQQTQIRLQGQGQYPTLFFDRKEVIMPVVPVGVQSVAMFKIINQGYQSISLKHRIQIYDLEGNCIVQGSNYYQNNQNNSIPQINVIFPQGVKMGINKRQLYIIVKFTCKKPVSFTCKLQLYDNSRDCSVYSIPISGTADCSILTLFPYLGDALNRYKLVASIAHQDKSRKQQASYTINLESDDDRNPVDKFHNQYDKMQVSQFTLDCQIIRRWINSFLKDQKVSKYPEDVIANPQNLLKLLYKMTLKKQFQTLIQVISNENRPNAIANQSVQPKQGVHLPSQHKNNTYFGSNINNPNTILSQILSVPLYFSSKLQFYQYLIKLLKSMGCLLNHIRPYFLLQKEQFFGYMQRDANWKKMSQTYSKNYEAMHLQGWIVLFYQIVSNFWYNTSKLKAVLAQNDKSQQISNIYSSVQMTVLRWIKSIYQKYNQFEDTFSKFMSYGQDFKDCVGLIYAAYHHIVNPSKKKKSLQGLTRKPSTPIEITSNIRILYRLIQKTGLIPLIYEEQFPLIREKQMFLFIYQLFQLLPQQLPKGDPVYFQCNLGQKCTKFIQIKNNSTKVVHYWVKLEGSRDFQHQEKEAIKVEAKSTYKFKVNFESRVSQEEVAYLAFLNKLQNDSSNNTAAGSTLVFELKSRIVGRKSMKKLQPIYCAMYQTQTTRIPVQNCFKDCEFANFQISLFEQLLQGSQGPSPKPKLHPLRCQGQTLPNLEDQIQSTDNKPLKQQHRSSLQQPKREDYLNFFVDNQTIKIKKNSTAFLELIFNPIVYRKVKCYLIFHDPLVGEFQYQIIGIGQIPKILQQIKHLATVYTGTKETVQVTLPVYNNYMIKANLFMEQRMYSKNGRQKAVKKMQNQYQAFKIQLNMDQKILHYVSFPQQHVVKNAKRQINAAELISKLKIQCLFPVVIKDLALDFLLINQDKKDVRRIKLHINLASKPIVSDLIMKTTARVPIIQPIPIQNTSLKDWRIKATLTQDEQPQRFGYLSLKQNQKVLSKDFVVKKNVSNANGNQVSASSNLIIPNPSSGSSSPNAQVLTLVFCPKWICKLTGKLIIQNMTTNQQLVYQIKGSCQQPISEGHVYFKLRTGSQQTRKVSIKNPYNQALTYKIQTDIQEMIKLKQGSISLQANKEGTVNIGIQALVVSKAIGYLKFTDEMGRFFWYTMTIEAYDDTAQEQTLQISTSVGEQVEKTFKIYNPSNQKVRFQIAYPPDCFITGEPFVQVQPQKTFQATLVFKPTKAFNKKSQLRIQNKTVGTLLYRLSLRATQTQKKSTQTLSAQVGKAAFTSFKITNSLKVPIRVKCQLLMSKYFDLQYNQVIQARSDSEVNVCFKPLEVGKYLCALKVFGQQFQTKCFQIEGIALQPFTVEKVQMKTNFGTPLLEIIKFKNPNPKKGKQKVEITIQDKQFPHNSFKIIYDKGQGKSWETSVSDVLGVPIQFNPTQKGYFQSMLYIKCAHYEWKYMLKGTTSMKTPTEVQQVIQGECRKQTIKIIKLQIPNYLQKQANFTLSMLDRVQIQCTDPKKLQKIRSWTQLKIQTVLQPEQQLLTHQQQQLTLYFKINPLQPIDEIVTFNIFNAQNQGSISLSHKVRLLMKPSQPDQTISIDVDSIKKYKFDINLDDVGVTSRRGSSVNCSMLKKDMVQCKFKNQNNYAANQTTASLNSSLKSVPNKTQNSIVQISFNPNNLTFNSTKGKSQYSDILMILSQKDFWSCEIVFKLISYSKKT